jgi:formate hydrogenlyase subunit 3/multisubunit Na+/H+ antiporter MnhD subunit
VGRNNPVAALALLAGLLSLAGFPLTPGFPGRWAMLSLGYTESNPVWSVLLITMITFALIVLRWAMVLFDPVGHAVRQTRGIAHQVFLLTGIASLLVLGIAPQILVPWVVEVAAGLLHLFP